MAHASDSSQAVFGPPIDARPFFARTRADLIELLAGLTADEWHRPTAAAPWLVRDVVAHLLGDDAGRLSRSRDQYGGPGPRGGESLPQFIHRLNDEWVVATARVSPALLVDLLRTTTPQVMGYWNAVDHQAPGEPVSWAGPDAAPVWLDCARDFTEDWVHQQQVRGAVDRPGSEAPEVLHAVLETFVRAVPHTLRTYVADSDDPGALSVNVSGAAGGRWSWRRGDSGWIWADPSTTATTSITMAADDLWKMCVRMIEPAEAASRAAIHGDQEVADAFFQTVSIIR